MYYEFSSTQKCKIHNMFFIPHGAVQRQTLQTKRDHNRRVEFNSIVNKVNDTNTRDITTATL